MPVSLVLFYLCFCHTLILPRLCLPLFLLRVSRFFNIFFPLLPGHNNQGEQCFFLFWNNGSAICKLMIKPSLLNRILHIMNQGQQLCGGLVRVYRKRFKRYPVPFEEFSSIELKHTNVVIHWTLFLNWL